MRELRLLENARATLGAQLTQIGQQLARHGDYSPEQFYRTLTYEDRTPAYQAHISALQAKTNWTCAELQELIVAEFTCNYNFVCGYECDYRNMTAPKPRAVLTAHEARDCVMVAYFVEKNYCKCLELIAAHPAAAEYQITSILKVKALFWCRRFAECYREITQTQLATPNLTLNELVFFHLQRALSAQALGRLRDAQQDCLAAEKLVQGAPPPRPKHYPAIFWLRAQLCQARGNNPKAAAALRALRAANRQPHWRFGDYPLTVRGEGYVEEFVKQLQGARE